MDHASQFYIELYTEKIRINPICFSIFIDKIALRCQIMCDEHIENEVKTYWSFVKIAECAETLAIQDFDTFNRSYFEWSSLNDKQTQ